MTTPAMTWIIDAIRGAGGEVEVDPESGRASFLMDPALASSLGMPEYYEISPGSGEESSSGAIPDLMEKCASLFGQRGENAAGKINSDLQFSLPSEKKAEEFLKLARGKATFHGVTAADQTYLAGFGIYSAVSDEKRDGIVSAAVNYETGTIAPGLGKKLEDFLEQGRVDPCDFDFTGIAAPALASLSGALRVDAVDQLKDFDATIGKRLERDCDRIFRYYRELMDGAVNVTGRKKQTAQEKEARFDAIRREYMKKTDDLRVKYLMKVEIMPVTLVAIRLRCVTARYTVQMGNARREILIPWNPLTSRPDVTVCERCGGGAETVKLCREFHWLCRQCWQQCTVCGKEYCPVCKPKGCSHG